MSTVYAYAVTINCAGENFIERVSAYNVSDAAYQAIMQFHAARNIAGKTIEDSRILKIEPDFTMVKKPTSDPNVAEEVIRQLRLRSFK